MNLRTVLHISRPRFWLYLAGPLLIGAAVSVPTATTLLSWPFLLLLAIFLVPANLFLYGINDLSDADTDAHNAKKGTKEHRLREQERSTLSGFVWFSAFCVLGVAAVFALQGLWIPSVLTLVFLGLGAGYSAPPVRFKAKPILDSASNVLYAVPGLIGYSLYAGALPAWPLIAAFACWTAAMHLFSAIPDIAADRRARLHTTATFLGQRRSLLSCSTLWLLFAAILVTRTDAGWFFAPAFVYAALPLALIGSPVSRVDKAYWWFPVLTGLFGFLVFWYVVLSRFGIASLVHS